MHSGNTPRRAAATFARRRALRPGGWALCALLAACAPSLDWRQLQPPEWTIALSLPCRPSQQMRSVPLAGAPVAMSMLSCSVDDQLFAVSSADLGDPARVAPALQALGEAARRNIGGELKAEQAAGVPGMTPQPEARRWLLHGRRPGGQEVGMEVLVFAHGTRVYQATALGPAADAARAAPLFDGLAVRR